SKVVGKGIYFRQEGFLRTRLGDSRIDLLAHTLDNRRPIRRCLLLGPSRQSLISRDQSCTPLISQIRPSPLNHDDYAVAKTDQEENMHKSQASQAIKPEMWILPNCATAAARPMVASVPLSK